MSAWVAIVVVFVLLLANAACVAAEFALVATTRASLEALAGRGHRGARRLLPLLSEPRRADRFLAATQLGITLASLGLGMYGESHLAQIFHDWLHALAARLPESIAFIGAHAAASTVALFVLTGLHLVLGEMVPKVVALEQPVPVLLVLAPPLQSFARLFSPFVALLHALGNVVTRLLGIRRSGSGGLHDAVDLQVLVHESQESGLLRSEAGAMVRRLFRFGDRTAADVMVPRARIVALPLASGPTAIRRVLKEHLFTRFLVYRDDLDHVLGQVHVKDLLRLVLAGGAVAENDVRKVPRVSAQTPLDRVIETMQSAKSQVAIVADPAGATIGLITFRDVSDQVIGSIPERTTTQR